ncbi:MAG: NADH-quinone oxidoreductase subunit J [Bacteroidia bacterium]|nr:NADH-quinone oxidoreductase subunit J [Bacteroidia bacterium]
MSYVFYFLSFVAILSALMMVFAKNPIHNVLWLILTFFSVAGHYILLNAQFLAAVHIIVYTGAIMVLFLFTIMLLNLNNENEPHKSILLKVSGVVAAGALMITILGALKASSTQLIGCNCGIESVYYNQVGLVKNLGKVLFTDFLMPFEVSSLLFLTAIVGAVVLGKKELGE